MTELISLDQERLARELEKLDIAFEQQLADEDLENLQEGSLVELNKIVGE